MNEYNVNVAFYSGPDFGTTVHANNKSEASARELAKQCGFHGSVKRVDIYENTPIAE